MPRFVQLPEDDFEVVELHAAVEPPLVDVVSHFPIAGAKRQDASEPASQVRRQPAWLREHGDDADAEVVPVSKQTLEQRIVEGPFVGDEVHVLRAAADHPVANALFRHVSELAQREAERSDRAEREPFAQSHGHGFAGFFRPADDEAVLARCELRVPRLHGEH